jgi:hypothetical protein
VGRPGVFTQEIVLRRSTSLALLALTIALAGAATAQARLPRDFFGIVPQTSVSAADTNRMRHGGVDLMRVPVTWAAIQPTPTAAFEWGGLDQIVATAARSRIRIVPFLYGTPRWLARRETTLPVNSGRQRQGWAAFVRAAAERYGTRGEFWREHWRGSGDYVPRRPIRDWQIWNEENFFYFTQPVSVGRYARLLRISHRALKRGDRRARLVLGGLFGNPKGRPPRAMDAAAFLDRLYRSRGIKGSFEGVALHPYAADTRELRSLTERLRRVVRRNRDPGARLYITEMGWGSQRNPRRVSFEVGWRPQARELRRSYRYLIRNSRRLNLKQVHWFTWKDISGACSFCDSTGLFRRGDRFKPKPAWHAFTRLAR